MKWFGNEEPLSDYGKIKLGEINIQNGNFEIGSKLIKEGWIKGKLSKADLRYLRKKYKKIITVSDNIKKTILKPYIVRDITSYILITELKNMNSPCSVPILPTRGV